MYERLNHVVHPVYQQFGEFKMLTKHEDEIDFLIRNEVYAQLNKILGVSDLSVSTSDFDLWGGEFDEKQYAVCSNSAYGYDFRALRVDAGMDPVASLATRIIFMGITDPLLQQQIFPAIPILISLPAHLNYDTLHRREFMPQPQVKAVLQRQADIDLSRFGL